MLLDRADKGALSAEQKVDKVREGQVFRVSGYEIR